MTFFCIFVFFICYFFNLCFTYLWSHMMLYVVIKIIIKILQFAMFELLQDLIKCVEKKVIVTDTDEKLLQGIVEFAWPYILD